LLSTAARPAFAADAGTTTQPVPWSFSPIGHPSPPAIHQKVGPTNPIDAFVLSKLDAQNLSPAPQADRLTLLRRACFDLTGLPPTLERQILDMSQWLNQRHMESRGTEVDDLSSRIASYELAFRMQSAVPEAVDLSRESQSTRELYGLDDKISARFGSDCLMARRLVERGVRFVQIFTGSAGGDDWDGAHAENDKVHCEMARRIDKPIAGLLKDLKARGLLDETLVIWGGEFGRTPIADGRYPDKRAGRDHNPYGFTTWLAGGGVKGGKIIGATDEVGFRAVEDPVHVNDLHATVLRLLGLDHRQLTFLFEGRKMRLTNVGGDHDIAETLLA